MQPKQPKAETQAMSEYGEPWKFRDDITHDPSGEPISEWDRSRDQRIVACVNALAGIPNPEAVRELIDAATAVDDALSSGNCKATVQQRQRLTWALDAVMTAPSASPQQK